MIKSRIRQNIISLYLIKFGKWFNLVMPVIVLFYQKNGLSMQDIFLLKSIYSIAIVVMEIPSGYFADMWGRKKTLLAGALLGAAGFALYSFSYTFGAFIIAEIVLGVGQSFISGADTAMLYDTLREAHKENDYIRQEGWITSSGNFAEAFAGIAGGLLATISLRLPFFFQFAVASIAIPAALFLKEPRRHRQKLAGSLKNILQTIRETARHPQLRSAILISSSAGTASLTFAWFVQPFFQAAKLPVSLFGIMWTLLNLSVGLSAIFSFRVERLLGQRRSLVLIIGGLTACYFLASWQISLTGIAFLFLFYLIRGVTHPILKDYINRYTNSEVRATILSLRDFCIRINFAIIGPVLGFIADRFSLGSALLTAGGGYLVTALLCIKPLWRQKNPSRQMETTNPS